MGIGKRIKEARLMKNMTQEELALLLGITKSAIANYENETSHPKESVLYKLFPVLSIDANYLYQDIHGMTPSDTVLSGRELKLLEAYRKLTDFQKETIDMLIEREVMYSSYQNTATISHTTGATDARTERSTASEPDKIIKLYPYLHNIASAGTGSYSDDIPVETISAAFMKKADFIIGVNGDSMEPMYHNGDLLYIQKTDQLSLGDIGIFTKNDSMYIKKVGQDRLLSINRAFPDILPEEEGITTVGRVLGKVEE